MAEASVPLPAVGVEDPQRRPPSRWPRAVAPDHHLRSLADDVAPEPDPRPPRELEPDAGRLADGGPQPVARSRLRAGCGRRLEDDEGDAGPPGERGEPAQSIAESRSHPADAPARQVDDQQVDRPSREQ